MLSIIVLISGCAVNPNPNPYEFDNPLTIDPPRGPILSLSNLNNFELTCSREQVNFLQGMRRNNVERQKATFGGLFREYGSPTPSRRSNWLVNQKLMRCRGYNSDTWGYEYYNKVSRDNKEYGKLIRQQRLEAFEERGWE